MRLTQTGLYWLVVMAVGWPGLAAAIQDDIPAPPDVNTVDRFGVNVATGQVSAGMETVSIGGDRGLSHSISMDTNHFDITGMYGPTDQYAGNAKYTLISNPDAPNSFEYQSEHYTLFHVMRVFGPVGSEDFLVYVGDELKHNDRNVTAGFRYKAMGDTRHTLEVAADPDYLKWTTPDGTELYYFRAAGTAGPDGDQRHAGTAGYLRKIIYPNGLTLNIEALAGVTTNTGYQLKYAYPPDHRGLSAEKVEMLTNPDVEPYMDADPAIPKAEPAIWAGHNPTHVVGINNAVDYCSPTTTRLDQACDLQHDWPTATFTWPGGMPRAMFIGENIFKIEDADGAVTEYHYKAQDVSLEYVNDPDSYVEGALWRRGERWSPRLVGIKTAGSQTVNRRYQYANEFKRKTVWNLAYSTVASEAGVVTEASGPQGSASYLWRQPVGASSKSYTNHGNQQDNDHTIMVETQEYPPGELREVDARGKGVFEFESDFRNHLIGFDPVGGPRKRYEYDNRGNLKQIEEQSAAGDRTVMQAGYPEECNNRKTCNKPLWVKDAEGHKTEYTYHPESGQVATVTGPPDADGVAPQKRYHYEKRHATYKTGPGTLDQDDRGLWLRVREAYCRTSAATGDGCGAGPEDEVVTEYDYGPQDGSTANNLRLRGVSVTAVNGEGETQTRTTCYEYDIYGRRIGQTQAKGVPAGRCP